MDKYAIRRAIVRALFDFENPQEFSVVLGHHAVILAAQKLALSNEEIRDVRHEWNYLIEKGYLIPVPGYDDYCRLSGDLRSTIASVDPLSGIDPLRTTNVSTARPRSGERGDPWRNQKTGRARIFRCSLSSCSTGSSQ